MRNWKASSLTVCVVLTTASGSSLAQAVTLFGVVDAAVRHVSATGGGSQNSLISGGNTTSRLGLKGVEDLGGGFSAGFHLESGLAIDEGTAGSNNMFFDRRTTVSLFNKQYGEIRLGRDRVLEHVLFSDLDPFAYTGIAKASNMQGGSATNLGPIRSAMGATPSGFNSLTRANNMIQYYFPTWVGLEAALMYQFRENATAVGGNHTSNGFRVKYTSGAYDIGIAQQRVRNSITAGDTLKDTSVGGGYDFGLVQLSLGARRWSYATSTQTNYLFGAVIPVGVGKIRLSYIKANLAGRVGATAIDANDASQIGAGYEHPLSKRTAVYFAYGHIDNKGRQTFTVGNTTAPGGTSKGFDIGLRHVF